MINIVCVYKSGGDYDAKYVMALKVALEKYCYVDYNFYCLTDKPDEIKDYAKIILLEHNLPGWWSKIELFNPNINYNWDNNLVLYFDLDVLILKGIQKLIEVCLSFTEPLMLRSRDPVGIEYNWPSSSIMSWVGTSMSEVYRVFFDKGIEASINETKNNIARAGQQTDQGFIRTILNPRKIQDYLPKNYIVFKVDYLKNPNVFDEITILNWTGKPRFHYMNKSFYKIKEIWDNRQKLIFNYN